MKAISLWQPWATLMAIHAKTIETRHWPIKHRGELAIHAAQTKEGMRIASPECWEALKGITIDFGAIVAVVDVYDCEPTMALKLKAGIQHWIAAEQTFGDFSDGRYGWLTRNPIRLQTPIPLRGQQGLWELPPDIEASVRAQL